MNTNDWSQHSHFAALDWACDHHDVVIVDRTGALVAEFRFAHTAAGWAEFTEKMKPYPGAPLALETSSGPAVDQLLQRGWTLHPVNPKAAERYRERKAPSGTKTDRIDAWSLGRTPCAPTATAGAHSCPRTKPPPPCAPSAAMRSPSSNNAPRWSTNSSPACASITPWP